MVIAVGIGFCLGLGLSATGLPMTGQSALAADIYVQDPADLVPAERAADEKLAAEGGAYLPIWLVNPKAWSLKDISQPEFSSDGLIILKNLKRD